MSKKLKTTTSYIIIGIIFAVVIAGAAIYYAYQEGRKYVTASENGYNMAFFELVDYVQNVETYLAKALISTTPEHGAETLTNVWREASVAQSCLAQLPINSNELENTSNEKLPSKSVIVPFEVPSSLIVAPMTGSPFASTTLPVTLVRLPVCF